MQSYERQFSYEDQFFAGKSSAIQMSDISVKGEVRGIILLSYCLSCGHGAVTDLL